MSYVLEDLEPNQVWILFEEISRIPRCSKHEYRLQTYLENWSGENNIDFKKDDTGNVLLTREHDHGFEHVPALMLQAHQDMVCEKSPESSHNFNTDPIPLVIESGKVKAKNTSLGADNGLGMALAMSILTDEKIIGNGKIEALFTVDEEEGFTGVRNLKPDFFSAKYMINLDSESIGTIIVSSAGSGSTTYTIDFRPQSFEARDALRVEVSGLKGGHSGVDIHLPRYNANKMLAQALYQLHTEMPLRLISFQGGTRSNVIPRNAHADILIPKRRTEKAVEVITDWSNSVDRTIEDDLTVKVETINQKYAAPISETEKVIYLLYELPYGVKSWSPEYENLVQTSNNPAIVNTDQNKFTIIVSSRTSDLIDGYDNQRILNELGNKYRVKTEQRDPSLGWKADPKSKLLNLVESSYSIVLGKKPTISGIHGGLECGVINGLKRNMDIVSIGPTIKNPHSPSEYVEVKGVDLLYNTLLMVVSKMRSL